MSKAFYVEWCKVKDAEINTLRTQLTAMTRERDAAIDLLPDALCAVEFANRNGGGYELLAKEIQSFLTPILVPEIVSESGDPIPNTWTPLAEPGREGGK